MRFPFSLHENPNFLAHAEVNVMRKSHLHHGDFVPANSKMADKTPGQLESVLRFNKAIAKAFEPKLVKVIVF